MSKFIDKIRSQLTGVRSARMGPLRASVKVVDSIDYDLNHEYDISVKWGRKVSCRPKDLEPVIDNVIRELREEIYGDIRSRIRRLELAVYEGNEKEMCVEIRDIVREIG